ncbi:hypothetical protein SAMN04487850_0745 [Prevotella aff. ruminicola Tc2-24]|uniref:SMODS and SLOG-associating 2TM effector domain-containing protein n=2 Tax=Prevotellaceae TaxID=171552 RepID=A0A1I0MMJ2_9BACT|nr:hypothetical protein SAMN04487828_0749 [Prevotella sp. lc2012]SEV88820.1 hypothetical protein SAMN04487850_0745 [Prevotella aff. ruminicola Tc2-24]
MIINRVWTEMYKAKSYLLQIELYNDKKRRFNRVASLLIVLASVICASTASFSECKWATIISAVIAAVSAIIKECLPLLMQSDEELKKMDNIYDFYKGYLQKLEKLFMERYDPNTDVDDVKMTARFDEIVKTEGSNESELNCLCRSLTKKEEMKIQELTDRYFDRIYNDVYDNNIQ